MDRRVFIPYRFAKFFYTATWQLKNISEILLTNDKAEGLMVGDKVRFVIEKDYKGGTYNGATVFHEIISEVLSVDIHNEYSVEYRDVFDNVKVVSLEDMETMARMQKFSSMSALIEEYKIMPLSLTMVRWTKGFSLPLYEETNEDEIEF